MHPGVKLGLKVSFLQDESKRRKLSTQVSLKAHFALGLLPGFAADENELKCFVETRQKARVTLGIARPQRNSEQKTLSSAP